LLGKYSNSLSVKDGLVAQKQSEIDNLNRLNSSLSDQLLTLKKRLQESDLNSALKAKLENDLADTKRLLAAANEEIARLNAKLREMPDALAYQNTLEQLERLRAQINAAPSQSELIRLEEENRRLREELMALKTQSNRSRLFAENADMLSPNGQRLYARLAALEGSTNNERLQVYQDIKSELNARVVDSVNFASGSSTVNAEKSSVIQKSLLSTSSTAEYLIVGYASKSGDAALKTVSTDKIMSQKVWLDGELVDENEAKISVFDHGLLYGDGIFEGIRFYSGRVFRLEEHIERLFDSAKAILMKTPWSIEEVCQATVDTCKANGLTDGYIRLVITRGTGPLGLNPHQCPTPSMFIIASGITLYPDSCYENGLEVVTCEQGYVAECTGDNIFVIKKGKISTPPVSDGSLDGITRQVIFELADELGYELCERTMTRYDLYTADEIFLTGTAAEVIPMVKLDEREIGDGKPGVISQKMITAFRKLANSEGREIV